MPFPIAAAISAGAGLFSSIFGNESDKKAHERDRQESIDDWNRNNEYNSPKAQMSRFKDAGLNPQLIYGQGTPGNASATPVSQQKSGNPSFKPDLAQIYGEAQRLQMNMQQMQQTVENLKTNQELIQANTDLANQLYNQRSINNPLQNANLQSQTTFRNGILEPTIANLNLKQNQTIQAMDLARQKNEREERLNKSQLGINFNRNQQILAQTALALQQRNKSFYDTALSQVKSIYERETLHAIVKRIDAQTEFIKQGKSTSLSIENLNKVNETLKLFEVGRLGLNAAFSDISRALSIGSQFKSFTP